MCHIVLHFYPFWLNLRMIVYSWHVRWILMKNLELVWKIHVYFPKTWNLKNDLKTASSNGPVHMWHIVSKLAADIVLWQTFQHINSYQRNQPDDMKEVLDPSANRGWTFSDKKNKNHQIQIAQLTLSLYWCLSSEKAYGNTECPENCNNFSSGLINTCILIFLEICSLPQISLSGVEDNTLRQRRTKRHSADIFKCISLHENILILIKISLTFIPKGSNNNIPELVMMPTRRQAII